MDDCAGTHDTGLERDIQIAAWQPVVAEALCRVAQGDDLGMGGRIVARDRRIEAASYDLAVLDHHGADRHLADGPAFSRQIERGLHEGIVRAGHSHSMVAGGLPEMSYTTRLIPRTSLMMRLETLASRP